MESVQLLFISHFLLFGICSSMLCPFPGIPRYGFGRVVNATKSTELLWDHWIHFQPDEKVEFYCESERRIPHNQNGTISCQRNGTWSAPMPRCERVSVVGHWWDNIGYLSSWDSIGHLMTPATKEPDNYCGFPSIPINGSGHFIGPSSTVFVYDCDEGFLMTGSPTAVCEPTTGQWTPPPICEYVKSETSWIPTCILVVGFLLTANLAVLIAKHRRL